MDNFLISNTAVEFQKLLRDFAWQIENSADNITVFSKGFYSISICAYDQQQNIVKLYNTDAISIKHNIRYIEIVNILCPKKTSDKFQLERIIKNISQMCDQFNITLYMNINKQYDSFEEFQYYMSEYNTMQFSLTIRNKLPYCVRFHKNEKYLLLPLPPDSTEIILELMDKLMLYANNPTLRYAYSSVSDDIFTILSNNKKTYKNAVIIEETLKSLLLYLKEDNESYGLYNNELNQIDNILCSIKKNKSFIM